MRKVYLFAAAAFILVAAPTSTHTALAADNGVWIGGKRIGADPDPTVRSQIVRDYLTTSGGGKNKAECS
jgi:hypothetical protein